MVYGAEEAQGDCVESFPLDKTEEDHPPLHESHWNDQAATAGAGKALQLLAMGTAATFKRFNVHRW